MKRLLALLAAGLMAATGHAAAQERAAAPLANTLHISAQGRYEAEPDTALVQFHIAAQAGTARAAYDGAARATEQVRALLRKVGVDPKSAEFGSFSIQPVYEWRPQQRLTGFRAAASVALRLKDFTQVGPVVQQLADVEGVGSHTVNYILEDLDEAKNRAVADAMRRARAAAAVAAEAGGRTLGELNHASVDAQEQARPMAMMARAEVAADASPPPTAEFTPQRVVVTARVQAAFNLR
jgi:uncharacterized protein YggE